MRGMKWDGASQRKGTLSRLEQDGQKVKAVTLYSHNFVLHDEWQRDQQKHLFYTAVAPTPEEAEAKAFAVYQQARECQHEMRAKGPGLTECVHCGVQRRVAPTAQAQAAAPQPQSRPQRGVFGLGLFGL